jgi:hypothetical protein
MEMAGMNKLSKDASLNIIESSSAYNPVPDLKRYNGPKLIVDIAEMEEQPNSLHKLFPEIPFKTIKGSSHWI